tara:strand:+ start:963 stop:1169 length:207 start_codon:yes stop_codon:yes gene_type:complete
MKNEMVEIVYSSKQDFKRTASINDYLNGAKRNDTTFTLFCLRSEADAKVKELTDEGNVIISQKIMEVA